MFAVPVLMGGAKLKTASAMNATILFKKELLRRFDRLRVMTPETTQLTAFEKDDTAQSRTVMNRRMLYLCDPSLHGLFLSATHYSIDQKKAIPKNFTSGRAKTFFCSTKIQCFLSFRHCGGFPGMKRGLKVDRFGSLIRHLQNKCV